MLIEAAQIVFYAEVLCFFVSKNFKRVNKSSLSDIIAKFYYEDELFAGKVELNNITDGSVPSMIEAWSKLMNKQWHPIARKAGDASHPRGAEADDLIQMVGILDVHKVTMPKFVAEDVDRVVAGCGRHECLMQSDVAKLTGSS